MGNGLIEKVICMTEKRFNLRAGYYDEYTGICGGNNENFTTNEVVELLNNQDDKIRELQERNDRQRKRLDNLYQLILNRDYDGQEELIKELEEYEQSLQDEMKLYCR